MRLAQEKDIPELLQVLSEVVDFMQQAGIDQWDQNYPNKQTLEKDIMHQQAYVYEIDNSIAAYVCLNQVQDQSYAQLNWLYHEPSLVIHRLFVRPKQQRKAIAKQILDFSYQYAKSCELLSIRLDTLEQNPFANSLYIKENYRFVGQVHFLKGAFNCYEKQVV